MIAVFLALLIGKAIMMEPFERRCTQQNVDRSVEIRCEGIPSNNEWSNIDNSTTHLIFDCERSINKEEISLENYKLQKLKKIKFFFMKKCKLFAFPTEYFKDLIYLNKVVLDYLPIKIFENNLFKNSSNLLELTLMGLENIQTTYPRCFGYQSKLMTLHLVESNITAEEMKPVLISVYVTLAELHWRKSKPKLSFPEAYFRGFNFDNLILESNGIDNTEFLYYVRTKILSLKNNPISKYKKFSLPKVEGLEILNLALTGLVGNFPEENTGLIHSDMVELIISDNMIEILSSDIIRTMPKLKILDVRNNRLTTLPSILHELLTKNAGRILLSDNMFHCNCELKWVAIGHDKLANDLRCRTMATINGTRLSNKTLKQTELEYELLCISPKLELKLTEQFKNRKYTITEDKINEKVYTVVLERGDFLNWKCEGRGNPAPKLKWVSMGQTLKVSQPSSKRYNDNTVMTNLIVEHGKQSQIYICKGSNIAGDTTVKLRLLRENESRVKPAMIISLTTKHGNIYSVYFIMTLFIIILGAFYRDLE